MLPPAGISRSLACTVARYHPSMRFDGSAQSCPGERLPLTLLLPLLIEVFNLLLRYIEAVETGSQNGRGEMSD